MLKLSGLLYRHRQACLKAECDCHELVSQAGVSSELALHENAQVYLTRDALPEAYQEGWIQRTFKVLIGDLNAAHGKDNIFCLIVAEVYFYYFANCYYALEVMAGLEERKPNVLVRQRMYNLRRAISLGLSDSKYREEDPERTIDSIAYLQHYQKFLDDVEEATDLTVQFWTVLKSETPTAAELNRLGKQLFETKYEIMKTVKTISDITSNHLEFLVRYGLFMKLVMHDSLAADDAFKKILYVMESATGSAFVRYGFSLFRGDISVMLIVASLSQASAATVEEMNTEVEQVLGYTRKDLVGFSITNLMPPNVAQRHASFVQKFFHTMQSSNINIPRFRFVKSKDGLYVPCKALTKIVPSLSEGLRVALFLVQDTGIGPYTCYRRDKTTRRVLDGAS